MYRRGCWVEYELILKNHHQAVSTLEKLHHLCISIPIATQAAAVKYLPNEKTTSLERSVFTHSYGRRTRLVIPFRFRGYDAGVQPPLFSPQFSHNRKARDFFIRIRGYNEIFYVVDLAIRFN